MLIVNLKKEVNFLKYKQFSLKSKSTYLHEIHPLTGDNLWIVQDLDLKETKQIKNLMQKFIDLYNQPDFNLSIFDTLTNNTIQINVNLQDLPDLVDYIYTSENAGPISFIGENSLTNSYIVGMELTFSKQIKCPGMYEYKNKKLIEVK